MSAIVCVLLLAAVVLSACTTSADPTATLVAEPTNTVATPGPQAPPATDTPTTAPPTAAPQAAQPVTKGMEAPGFSLQDLDGNPRSLSDFRGKVVMLNFWASWCGFCRSEIPHMNTVYAEYADQGFEIVAVSLGEDPEHLRQFAAENNMAFPILPDVEGITVPLYLIQSIPASYFLNAEGVVQAVYGGAIQEETLRTIVKTLLAQ
jgi:peroxiredoxin